jgi:catechol 2,3-dioxygenase-like lactoylglutathione lyase family enzyme
MSELNRIVAFVMTKNPEKATAFYRDTLGFELLIDDGFALVFDAHGTMLRVVKAKEFTPAAYTILGWQVEAIQDAVSELKQRGVTFERFPGLPQDNLGIWTAPSGDKVAWFKDADGNVLSVSQHLQKFQ